MHLKGRGLLHTMPSHVLNSVSFLVCLLLYWKSSLKPRIRCNTCETHRWGQRPQRNEGHTANSSYFNSDNKESIHKPYWECIIEKMRHTGWHKQIHIFSHVKLEFYVSTMRNIIVHQIKLLLTHI